jgi:hypothetical protein
MASGNRSRATPACLRDHNPNNEQRFLGFERREKVFGTTSVSTRRMRARGFSAENTRPPPRAALTIRPMAEATREHFELSSVRHDVGQRRMIFRTPDRRQKSISLDCYSSPPADRAPVCVGVFRVAPVEAWKDRCRNLYSCSASAGAPALQSLRARRS